MPHLAMSAPTPTPKKLGVAHESGDVECKNMFYFFKTRISVVELVFSRKRGLKSCIFHPLRFAFQPECRSSVFI